MLFSEINFTDAFIPSLAIIVLMLVGMYKIFEKAGEPGYKALIPIYNIIILIKIVGFSPWLVLLFLIPVANTVFAIIVLYRLSVSFNHDILFLVGLLLLPYVFIPYLGLSKDIYIEKY